MNDTWICEICKEERPDDKISVLSYSMKDLPCCMRYVKYCNDKPECRSGAEEKRKNKSY